MSEKILTIAICAYNMEQYIAQAVESCICKNIDKIEVLVMNDGSTDKTAEIVQKYCDKYPDSIYLINKANGGWGSNLNEAVKLANGKYFKELDADDWFDTEELDRFICALEKYDADMFYNYYRQCYIDHTELCGECVRPYGGEIRKLNDIKEGILFTIWAVCFRTELLKKYHRNLPEHTLYTDTLFIMQVLPYIEEIYITDLCVYQYRLGREGQSVDKESIKKHFKESMKVTDTELQIYKQTGHLMNRQHMQCRIQTKYECLLVELIKIYGEVEENIKSIIVSYEKRLKKEFPELYHATGKRKLTKFLRMTGYLGLPIAKKMIGDRFY